jgi:hypothetical protein
MPEIGSSGLMSGDGKRAVGHRPQATAPILDSTKAVGAPELCGASALPKRSRPAYDQSRPMPFLTSDGVAW